MRLVPSKWYGTYCWWKKSCTSWYGKYPNNLQGFSTMSGGWEWDFFHQQEVVLMMKVPTTNRNLSQHVAHPSRMVNHTTKKKTHKVSNVQQNPWMTFHDTYDTDWLIGILIVAYYNPPYNWVVLNPSPLYSKSPGAPTGRCSSHSLNSVCFSQPSLPHSANGPWDKSLNFFSLLNMWSQKV